MTSVFQGAVLPAGVIFSLLHALSAPAREPQTFPDFRVPIRSPGDAPITLPAAAVNSGLPLAWTAAAGPVTISGNVATLTGALGGVTLRAAQAGNAEWEPLEQFVTFPVTAEGAYQEVTGLSSGGSSQILAITHTGRLMKLTTQKPPVAVWSDARWKTVSSSRYQLAVSEDGRLWSWGEGAFGELGHGINKESLSVPVPVGVDTDWDKACAGPGVSTAIKRDGTLWAWGFLIGNVPNKITDHTDWEGLSSDGADHLLMRRTTGSIYGPNFGAFFRPILPFNDWKSASTSAGGMAGIRSDGSLWTNHQGELQQVGSDVDWLEASSGRTAFIARRADGSLWGGGAQRYGFPADPVNIDCRGLRWKFLHAGYMRTALISEDGGLWMLASPWFRAAAGAVQIPTGFDQTIGLANSSLYRLAPDYFPQRLTFLDHRERPVPVTIGSKLPVGAAECASGMPPAITVLSGPATVEDGVITFTGEGAAEIRFTRPGDDTWSELAETVTFHSGPPAPEIAVHDGPSAATAPRQNNGAVTNLWFRTKAVASAGLVRSFTLENTGSLPLTLTGVTEEAPSPLTFTAAPVTAATLAPGESLTLALTLRAVEYGTHSLTVLLHTNDADEGVYRLPFTITVENTPPVASAGPDRVIPAGSAVRLDGAFFTNDYNQPARNLNYAWDLDGSGFTKEGAEQMVTLAAPGDTLTAKLRARDGDGAESFDECVLTAGPANRIAPTAIRLTPTLVELTFPGEPGANYNVQTSTDLQQWRAARFDGPDYQPTAGADGFFQFKIGRIGGWNESEFFRASRVE